jgi:hypothetical protein
VETTKSIHCPAGWDKAAQYQWEKGNKKSAIDSVMALINKQGRKKPAELVLQLSYYVFLIGDPVSAAQFLAIAREDYPSNTEVLKNLAVCLACSGQDEQAIRYFQELLVLQPNEYLAFDSLSRCFSNLGQYDQASSAGTRALMLKDQAHGSLVGNWRLPEGSAVEFASSSSKKNVISFSLWGKSPRYLRGAIDNALAAPAIYPGWTLRFFVDETVPSEIRNTLLDLGAEIQTESLGQSNRQRLTWRFKVANDYGVGRFLVRDVDSVISFREKSAVDEWIASDRWFHVMRDWWTHTDLILAGMWGGVAGVLPSLLDILNTYQAGAMETPNVDQWFLRDKVWAYVRGSCLIHDRCFRPQGARPWPEQEPEGNAHVGQNEFGARREAQEKRLANWLPRLKSLSYAVAT